WAPPCRRLSGMKKLLSQPHVSSMERLLLYASTIAFQWLATAIVAWRAWAHRYTDAQLGLVFPDRLGILLAAVVGGATIATLQWLNLRRVGRIPVESRGALHAIAARISPQSPPAPP